MYIAPAGHHGTLNPVLITNKEDMQISEGVIRLKPSTLAHNTLLDRHNSSYHTQPLPIIANYTAFSFKAAQAKSLDFWLIHSN